MSILHEFLELTLHLGIENPTERTTVLMNMHIRLPVEGNFHTHSRLTTFCCIFSHVSLHQKLDEYVYWAYTKVYAYRVSHKQVIEYFWKCGWKWLSYMYRCMYNRRETIFTRNGATPKSFKIFRSKSTSSAHKNLNFQVCILPPVWKLVRQAA